MSEKAINTPRRIIRGTREVDHDLFKLKISKFLRNTSWVHEQPTIMELEHVHIYHSVDGNTLKDNEYSAPVGGHFHKVEVDWSSGDPVSKCGPPLQFKVFKSKRGQFKKIVPVEWGLGEVDPLSEEGKKYPHGKIIDNHTHEVEYIHSEALTLGQVQQSRQDEKYKVQAAMTGQPKSTQSKKANSMQENAAKVAHVVIEKAGMSKDATP